MGQTSAARAALIDHVDGFEIPASGRWYAVPAYSQLALRSPRLVGRARRADGAAVAGTIDIDAAPERCRIELSIDRRRLSGALAMLAEAVGGHPLGVDAARTGPFDADGWNVAGTVTGGADTVTLDARIDYRGVFRRRPDFAYAWFTTSFSVPASVLGCRPGRLPRSRRISVDMEILAIPQARAGMAASA